MTRACTLHGQLGIQSVHSPSQRLCSCQQVPQSCLGEGTEGSEPTPSQKQLRSQCFHFSHWASVQDSAGVTALRLKTLNPAGTKKKHLRTTDHTSSLPCPVPPPGPLAPSRPHPGSGLARLQGAVPSPVSHAILQRRGVQRPLHPGLPPLRTHSGLSLRLGPSPGGETARSQGRSLLTAIKTVRKQSRS